MGQLIITKNPSANSFIRKRTLSQQVRIGAFSLMMMILALIAGMGILFLTRFNSIATKGYLLNSLERDRIELIKQIERREMEIAKLRTLESILAAERTQSMVKLNNEKILYMRRADSVAVR